MTRSDPANGGAGSQVGTCPQNTTSPLNEATVSLARVRWRGPAYGAATATRVKLYSRSADAEAAAERLRSRGYDVELSSAERTAWSVTRPASWSSPDLAVVVAP